MSYTSSTCVATCVLDVNNKKDVVNLYVDWLENNPDEVPEHLDGMTREEIEDEVSSYVEADENGEVTVTLDTEGDNGNWNQQVFNSIYDHLCTIQVSDLMKVECSTYDSRDGMSSTTSYYDKNGNWIDIVDKIKDSNALDLIASMLSGSEWDPETMTEVAEIIRATGRTVADVA